MEINLCLSLSFVNPTYESNTQLAYLNKEFSKPMHFEKTVEVFTTLNSLYGMILVEEAPYVAVKLTDVAYNITKERYESRCAFVERGILLYVEPYREAYPQIFASPEDLIQVGEVLLGQGWLWKNNSESNYSKFLQELASYYKTYEGSKKAKEKLENLFYFVKDWQTDNGGKKWRELTRLGEMGVEYCSICKSEDHAEEECPFKG